MTPARKENPNVAEFRRLFTLKQERVSKEGGVRKNAGGADKASDVRMNDNENMEDRSRKDFLSVYKSAAPIESTSAKTGNFITSNNNNASGSNAIIAANNASNHKTDNIATECFLYGYKDKSVEWKVIDKYERISQGFICEDYARTDPDANPRYPQFLSGIDVVIPHRALTADANRKSKRYAGGFHWIKITFDSSASAERACQFSPQEIDGFMVYCDLYSGHGPREDKPIPKGFEDSNPSAGPFGRTSDQGIGREGKGLFNLNFDRPLNLRSQQHQQQQPQQEVDIQQKQEPQESQDQDQFSFLSTMPGSFAATERSLSVSVTGSRPNNLEDALRQRNSPTLSNKDKADEPALSSKDTKNKNSKYMAHLPNVRRAALRPASEALASQPGLTDSLFRNIPLLGWLTSDLVGEGPAVKEDGTFDFEKSNGYWRVWYIVDMIFGTDLCGLKSE